MRNYSCTRELAELVHVLYHRARLKGALFVFTSEETNGRPKLFILYAILPRQHAARRSCAFDGFHDAYKRTSRRRSPQRHYK